jgi:Ca-activated chloride channel homolog
MPSGESVDLPRQTRFFPRRNTIQSALFSAFLLPVALSAQTQPAQAAAAPPDAGGPVIFSSEARYVPLNVTVTDKNDHLVTNLPESDFQIFENNVLQPIKVFKREDVPVSMGLVIDNSGSMRSKRAGVEASALALVKDSNVQDETFVVNFNDEPYLDQDFTSDTAVLQKGLERIDSKGGTAMRDAIRVSVDHLHDKAKHDKKVIIVITDGNDNASMVTLESLKKLAQQDGTLIYAIGLLGEEDKSEANKAKRDLKLLVESTGGQVFYPKDVSEVEPIAHQVAHDIRNQYSIWYAPLNDKLDGTFRSIKVTVKAPGNPVARTRLGYWATPSRKPTGSSNPQ